jgi:hypothetical protein
MDGEPDALLTVDREMRRPLQLESMLRLILAVTSLGYPMIGQKASINSNT